MSIFGWIFFGVGLLVASFIGFLIGRAISNPGTREMGLTEASLGFIVPVISLVVGIVTRLTFLKNSWLILAAIGGVSLAIGVIIGLTNRPNVEKLKSKGDVKGLIEVLGYSNIQIRKAAAESLIALYKSGEIDDEHKKLILSKRNTITQGHSDRNGVHQDSHSDRTTHRDSRDCLIMGGSSSHFDYPAENKHVDKKIEHVDTGIGVDFPL